ncbi:MAG: inner membrane-spanning protein YciB, partial [Hyphomicrobiaceae bacterium]
WQQKALYITLKPTIDNSLFATILYGGLAFGHSLLRHIFADAFLIDDDGWRKLTFRWALFFVLLAVLNEIVWRNFSTDTWVAFKTFGIMPLTMVFAIAQLGLIRAHQLEDVAPSDTVRDSD